MLDRTTRPNQESGLVLDHLIDPVRRDNFFSKYFEKQPLHVGGRPQDWFGHVLKLGDVDYLLTSDALRPSALRILKDGQFISEVEYAFSSGRADPRKLMKAFTSGATIIIDNVSGICKNLGLFCAELEHEFGCRVQANIYLTPPNSAGFNTHFDTHDVFIVQIAGKKQWKLWDFELSLPLPEQYDNISDKYSCVPASKTINLQVGDTLYIPRGVAHQATSPNDDFSLHATIGIHYALNLDLILDAVYLAGTQNLELRRSLPFDKEGNYSLATEDCQRAIDVLKDSLDNIAIDELALRAKHVHVSQFPYLTDHFLDTVDIENIKLNTRVYWRRSVQISVFEKENDAILAVNENRIAFPEVPCAIFDSLLRENSFLVKNMPDSLSSNSKLVIVRRLLREGALSLVNSVGNGWREN